MLKRFLLSTTLAATLTGVWACGDSPTTPTVTTYVEVFASRIQEGGSAWRTFTVPKAGEVKVQFVSISQADAVVGLGIGTVDGVNCALTQSLETGPNGNADSPQITTTLNAGTYCVRIWDVGNLTTIVNFSIAVTRPY